MRRLMSKQKNNVDDLLAAIKRQPTSPTSDKSSPEPGTMKPQAGKEKPKRETSKMTPPERKAKNKYGKPVQFYLHDDDRNRVREFYAWLAGQGIRPTDSLVIRGALRITKTGSALLEACKEAAQLDGRLKQD